MFHYRKGLPITVAKNTCDIWFISSIFAKPGHVSILSPIKCYVGPLPFKPATIVYLKKMLNVISNEKDGYFDDVIAAASVVQESSKHGDGAESGSEVWDSD